MGFLQDIEGVTAESLPTILLLIGAIIKLANSGKDEAAQLDALESAAEAVKARLDEIKFGG